MSPNLAADLSRNLLAPAQRICGWCRKEIAPGTQTATLGICHRCFVYLELEAKRYEERRGVMASDTDTDRRILAYLDGKNSSAALSITDEQMARSLGLELGNVRNSVGRLENDGRVRRDGQNFRTERD